MSGEDQKIAGRVDAESTVPRQKEAEPENDNTEIVYPKGVELVELGISLPSRVVGCSGIWIRPSSLPPSRVRGNIH